MFGFGLCSSDNEANTFALAPKKKGNAASGGSGGGGGGGNSSDEEDAGDASRAHTEEDTEEFMRAIGWLRQDEHGGLSSGPSGSSSGAGGGSAASLTPPTDKHKHQRSKSRDESEYKGALKARKKAAPKQRNKNNQTYPPPKSKFTQFDYAAAAQLPTMAATSGTSWHRLCLHSVAIGTGSAGPSLTGNTNATSLLLIVLSQRRRRQRRRRQRQRHNNLERTPFTTRRSLHRQHRDGNTIEAMRGQRLDSAANRFVAALRYVLTNEQPSASSFPLCCFVLLASGHACCASS